MMGFFNVVTNIKIGGKLHVPCISYAVTPNNKATILKLVQEGKAEITVEEAVFQSGKKIEKEKQKAKKVDMSFVREKIKEFKEPKETKEDKEPKETKEDKETKEAKETKETKEAKEAKEAKETKETKEEKIDEFKF